MRGVELVSSEVHWATPPPWTKTLSFDSFRKRHLHISDPDLMFQDHLLQWLEISVSEPEKRVGTSSVKMQETYVVYLVETK